MKSKFWVAAALLGFFATSCAAMMMTGEEKYGKEVPVITQSFASKQVSAGEAWRVYINASDADGDMDRIYCSIHQPGVFPAYPGANNKIAQDQQKNLSGYLYLDTSGIDRSMDIYLTLSIRDKAGHFSVPVTFHLDITQPSGMKKEIRQEDPPRGTFEDKNLGAIMIFVRSDVG
jgi:hypothetical protein